MPSNFVSKNDTEAPWRAIPIGEEWNSKFRSFQKSAFRLEVLQAYAEPSEAAALSEFLQGHPPKKEFLADWCRMVEAHTRAGRIMSRVHVVDLPLSDYMRFEIAGAYGFTSEAGEQIYLLNRAVLPAAFGPLANEDFWLFDDTEVIVQIYNNEGTLVEAHLTQHPEAVSRYRRIREHLLHLAVPYREFCSNRLGKGVGGNEF